MHPSMHATNDRRFTHTPGPYSNPPTPLPQQFASLSTTDTRVYTPTPAPTTPAPAPPTPSTPSSYPRSLIRKIEKRKSNSRSIDM